MDKDSIVAFYLELVKEQDPHPDFAQCWRAIDTLDEALQQVDKEGREKVLWANSYEEACALLAERFPSVSGYPRVIALPYRYRRVLVLARNCAIVPEDIDDEALHQLLRNRQKVLFPKDSPRHWPDGLEREKTRRVVFWDNRHFRRHIDLDFTLTLVQIRRETSYTPNKGPADATPAKRALHDLSLDMRNKVYEAVHAKYGHLRLISISHQGSSYWADCTTAQLGSLFSNALVDWRDVFGQKNTAYRRLEAWKRTLPELAHQRLLRQLSQYLTNDQFHLFLVEIVAAQRRHLKGATPAREWPVAELLAQNPGGREHILKYRPPRKKKGKKHVKLECLPASVQPGPADLQATAAAG